MSTPRFIIAAVVGCVIGFASVRIAQSDGSGSGSAIGSAGSGSAVAIPDGSILVTPAPTPADALHDPLKEPAAAIDDVKAAKSLGWPVLVLAVVTLLARLAGSLGKSIPLLAPLGKGKVALVVGAIAAIGAAGYSAAFGGGSLVTIATAVLIAGIAAWNAAAKVTA